MTKKILKIFLIFLIAGLNSCSEDDPYKEVYLEGEPIPGVEIFFPLGFYNAEPLMPKISPDGKKLLFSGPTSLPEWKGLWVMDLETQEKTLLHLNGRLGDWSHDSQWVVFNIGSAIYKIKSDASSLVELLSNDGYFEPDWSSGDLIYFGGNLGAGTINQDGSLQKFYEQLGGHGDWHPTENKIISSKDSGLRVFDLDLNNYIDIPKVVEDDYDKFPKYSKSGDEIIFFNKKGIYKRDLIDNSVIRILPNQLYNSDSKPQFYCAYPSWHPDGQRIIYEHFVITKSNYVDGQLNVQGKISFYIVDVEKASIVSNLY